MNNVGNVTDLKSIDTKVDQSIEFLLVPFSCCRIGKVDDGQTGLPEVPLPRRSVFSFDKVTTLDPFFEDRRELRYIWIDCTD